MNTNKIKDKKVGLVLIFLTVFLLLFTNLSFAQNVIRFPHSIDFTKGKPNGVIILEQSVNLFNSHGLLLTPAFSRALGGVLFDSMLFDSTNGLVIEFEYSIYGGTPDSSGNGLSFFICDGSIDIPSMGAKGEALGYVYDKEQKGLSKAYLGVGFDVYGSFKTQAKGHRNGINLDLYPINSKPVSWSDQGRSHITLRGAYDPENNNGNGIYFSGYPVLATQSTIATPTSVAGNVYSGARLDPLTAEYIMNNNYLNNNFNIRNGERNPSLSSPNYRKAFIILTPVSLARGGGFYVTVRVQAGTKPPVTVIDKYHYSQSVGYTDNHLGNSHSAIYSLNARVPSTFKIGFTASTGTANASEAHLIKTLKIALPYGPAPSPDSTQFCYQYSKQSSIMISPFDNDLFYTGLIDSEENPKTGNKAGVHIDYNTFRFEDSNGNLIGGTISSVANGTLSFRQPNVGLWVFSTFTGKVTFTPDEGFAGDAVIYYSAKGPESNVMPYGQEVYRSAPTKITVKGIRCNTISNPQLPSNRPVTSGK